MFWLRIGHNQQDETGETPTPWSPNPASLLVSLAAHTVFTGLLFYLPPSFGFQETVKLKQYEVVMLPKKKEILWLPVPSALPDLSPERRIGVARRPQGRVKSRKESILVQPPDATAGRQFTWRPDKPLRLETEVPAANMIALRGSEPKSSPKPFVPPPPPSLPKPVDRIQAPDIEITPAQTMPTAGMGMAPVRVKPKTFQLPKDSPKLPLPVVAVTEAPPDVRAQGSIQGMPNGNAAPGTGPVRAVPRRFVPPPGSQAGSGSTTSVFEKPPEVAANGGGMGAVTGAVIGLDSPGVPQLPEGSRLAAFSRAPRVGEPSSGEPGAGLKTNIPGVSIQGSHGSVSLPRSTPPPPIVQPAPGTKFEISVLPPSATMSAPLRPFARTVPRAVEAKFADRVVYTIVIPKPGLPFYPGDWTIWFAEKSPGSIDSKAPMRAPVPIRKNFRPDVPVAVAGGPDRWVQLTAVITKEGKLADVMPLPSRIPDVASFAAVDFSEWEFRPAARNGEPIEVETLIELPFRGQPGSAPQ